LPRRCLFRKTGLTVALNWLDELQLKLKQEVLAIDESTFLKPPN